MYGTLFVCIYIYFRKLYAFYSTSFTYDVQWCQGSKSLCPTCWIVKIMSQKCLGRLLLNTDYKLSARMTTSVVGNGHVAYMMGV